METLKIECGNLEKETGTGFPQTDGMIPGYDLDAPNSIYSLNLWMKIPEIIERKAFPNLDGIALDSKAKMTDLISTGLISSSGLLLSEKAKNCFEDLTFAKDFFFPGKLYTKTIQHSCYWYYPSRKVLEWIDFTNSVFEVLPLFGFSGEKVIFKSKEEYIKELNKSIAKGKRVRPLKLSLSEGIFQNGKIASLSLLTNGSSFLMPAKAARKLMDCGLSNLKVSDPKFEVVVS